MTQAYGAEVRSATRGDLAAVNALYPSVVPNDASVRLHLRFGFREVGRFSEVGRKFGRYWDVAWYEKALGP